MIKPDPSGYSGDFWRKKLAASLGVDPAIDDEFLLSAHNSHLAWRKKAAAAIGVSPNLSDADLLQAHARHMAEVEKAAPNWTRSLTTTGMPPASVAANTQAASLQNEKARRDRALSLVQEIMASDGIGYDEAFLKVRRNFPKYFQS